MHLSQLEQKYGTAPNADGISAVRHFIRRTCVGTWSEHRFNTWVLQIVEQLKNYNDPITAVAFLDHGIPIGRKTEGLMRKLQAHRWLTEACKSVMESQYADHHLVPECIGDLLRAIVSTKATDLRIVRD